MPNFVEQRKHKHITFSQRVECKSSIKTHDPHFAVNNCLRVDSPALSVELKLNFWESLSKIKEHYPKQVFSL
jgi:hypothetical protein